MTFEQNGIASWYDDVVTASGETFNRNALTAAHKTLPFGTKVKVTRTSTGQSVIVVITDRGPFEPGRIIDLTHAGAVALDMIEGGVAVVHIEVVA